MYKDFIEHRNGTGTKLNCECGGVGVWDETSCGLNIPVISYTITQIQRSECNSTNKIKTGTIFS